MFDTFLDLPVHVLVVHAVVVLGPIAALTAMLYAVWPGARRVLRWPLLALAAVAAGSAWVATQSGDELEDRLSANPDISAAQWELIETHTDAGDTAFTATAVLLVLVVVCVTWALTPGRSSSVPAVVRGVAAVALVAVAAWALFALVRAGHSGAEAAWLLTIRG